MMKKLTDRKLTPYEQFTHPHLFGALPKFRNLATWEPWLVVVKSIDGVPLTEREQQIFTQHTGRTYSPPPGGYAELIIIVGVQSGKTTIASTILASKALTGEPGTYALGLCQDHRGAMRVLLRNAREPFENLDLFRAEVARSTADTLELHNGVTLAAYPCRPEAVRGLRACMVVIDELAFFTATDGRPMDQEMLRVARGRVATTGGKVVVISSPYGQSGALWELHRKHYGREDSSTLVWQSTAPQMNPTLPADYLNRMQESDPQAYRSEVLGEFRAGLSTLIDPHVLDACIDRDVRERLPQSETTYSGFVDAASGSGKDSFTVGIAHADGERVILDVVRAWKPPFNPSGVIAECADLLKKYRVHEVRGDKYAPGFVSEGFRTHGISYEYSEHTASELYLEFLPLLNAEKVVLLDHLELLRELRGLERRRGTSGRDKVDHRPGAHDDMAVSCAGALILANKPDLADLCTVL